jgi:hypothetical protein
LNNLENMTKVERRVRRQRRRSVGGGVLGGLGGAGIGALAAGPIGAAAGALIGVAMGGAIAWAAEGGAQEAADRNSQLDIEIGVDGGDMGAPGLEHPPPTIGAYSRESSGAAGLASEVVEAEGPIQPPPE